MTAIGHSERSEELYNQSVRHANVLAVALELVRDPSLRSG